MAPKFLTDVIGNIGETAIDAGTDLFRSIANAFGKKTTDAIPIVPNSNVQLDIGSLPNANAPRIDSVIATDDISTIGALPKQTSGFDVYHGTPHNFPPVRELQMPDGTRLFQDLNESVELPEGATVLQEYPMGKFDITKIGTGEGAQVYGRGLYFAEEEDVAKMYRDQLSGGNSSAAAAKLDRYKGDVDAAIDDSLKILKRLDEREAAGEYVGREDVLDTIRQMQNKNLRLYDDYKKNGKFSDGKIYKVRIDADPDNFIDWDKTVGSQSQKVKSSLGWTPDAEQAYLAARNADDDALMRALSEDASGVNYVPVKLPIPKGSPSYSATGQEVAGKSSIFGSAAQAAEALKNRGIAGVKYLDQGSRPTGDGTRNYVVFDDRLISIVKKYGVAGAATMLGVSILDVEQAIAQGSEN